VISDVDTFADGLLMGFTQLFTGVMTIAGTLILMLTIQPFVALVVIVITPLSLVVANFIASRTYSMFRLQSATRGEQTALIDETIGEMKLVRAFSQEDALLQQFDEINGRLEKASLRAIFFSSMTNPATRFVNSVVYAAVALTGALMCIGGAGGFTVGNLTTFLNYANQYTKPFNEISGVVTELQNALACAGRVFELIEAPARSPEPENPQQPERVQGAVEIRDLKFSYVPEKPLIDAFHLSVKPGQRVAIVGPTGCGKTTFINLLMRFYDPQGGEIKLDGIDTTVVAYVENAIAAIVMPKASAEITVAEDGTLGIGTVNVNKLSQTEGEELILNGGNA
jgi:ATP-binding cassette subfamily B protein